jgi:hypothetical protein
MEDLRLPRRFRILCKYSVKAIAINAKRHILRQEMLRTNVASLANGWGYLFMFGGVDGSTIVQTSSDYADYYHHVCAIG